MKRSIHFLTIPVALASSVFAGPVDFNREIRPILADNCFECHGPDEEHRKAGLRLDTRTGATSGANGERGEAAIVPGDLGASSIYQRLVSHDPDEVMPPPKSTRQPTKGQIALLRRWIEEGANYDKHWSFLPPVRREAPAVDDPAWRQNSIDAFVRSHLEERGWEPRPEAPPGVLARRLSLALTGLPASVEQIDAFTAGHARDPDTAIASWVDELLSVAAYGEHLSWMWMDAARYADTNGYQADGPRVMWPWRDWLIDTLNANVSFDEMTRQMLAGDRLVAPDYRSWESADWIPDSEATSLLTATGFLRNHRYDTGSGTIPAESKFENAADRLETVGTVWMGLTLQCARCHNHKFDPLATRDYYGMLAFFDKIPEVGSAIKDASHPYIRIPGEAQEGRLRELSVEQRRLEQELKGALTDASKARGQWIDSITHSGKEVLRVKRGLRHHFAREKLVFDGSNAQKKSADPVSLCAGNKEWTISFRFRPDRFADGAIFSSVDEPERYRPGIQADWIGGKIRVRHVCRWVNSYIEFESREKLEAGKWYHVTFRSDGRMQGLAYSVALDGDFDAMVCTHPVTNDSAEAAGKAPLILGGSPLLPGFHGALHDLRFYDREITPAEVRSLADPRSTLELVTLANPDGTESEMVSLAFLESDSLPGLLAEKRDRLHAVSAEIKGILAEAPTVMVMKDELEHSTRLRAMGAYDRPTDPVEPGTPAILPPLPETGDQVPDRLALADWLMKPGHPLTARVAVNRIWQLLWGRGFVSSPENFGTQCAEPIHAELLDWLATEYIRLGWDTKALIRTIVTSRTYLQDSSTSEALWAADPANEHLARGPRFRLPIATVRDQALAVSGRLDGTTGGPPVLLGEVEGKDGKPMKLPHEINPRRRSLYTFWKRNSPHPMFAVFDVADRNQCDVRTRRTNTPLQALVTLNEPGLAECARDLGRRARESGEDEEARLVWMWQACTGRRPAVDVIRDLSRTLADYRDNTPDEESAWAALGNVLLNLDATLTLE